MTGALSRSSGLREICRTPHIVLRHDPGRRFLVITRTVEPYASLDALRQTFAQLDEAVSRLPRQRTVALIDSRRAPARNDPEFEAEFGRLRKHFLRDLHKIATVVQTAVGKLQVSRHMRADELQVGVFTDFADALAHLGIDVPVQSVDFSE